MMIEGLLKRGDEPNQVCLVWSVGLTVNERPQNIVGFYSGMQQEQQLDDGGTVLPLPRVFQRFKQLCAAVRSQSSHFLNGPVVCTARLAERL